MSQFWPVQPGEHSQKYPPIRLRQELALAQGLLSHSLASGKWKEGVSDGLHVRLTGGRRNGALTYQASFPRPLRRTQTLVTVHQVLAGASVVAGVRRAVVHV